MYSNHSIAYCMHLSLCRYISVNRTLLHSMKLSDNFSGSHRVVWYACTCTFKALPVHPAMSIVDMLAAWLCSCENWHHALTVSYHYCLWWVIFNHWNLKTKQSLSPLGRIYARIHDIVSALQACSQIDSEWEIQKQEGEFDCMAYARFINTF